MYSNAIFFALLFEFCYLDDNADILKLLRRQNKAQLSSDQKKWLKDWQKYLPEELYNPNFGYEQYWPNGEWVFETTTQVAGNQYTSTKPPMYCGEDCHYLYQRVGKVCGYHQTNVGKADQGCDGFWVRCKGNLVDNYQSEIREFESYCDFLAEQCKNDDYEKRWILITTGECENFLRDVIRPVDESYPRWTFIKRTEYFLNELGKRGIAIER